MAKVRRELVIWFIVYIKANHRSVDTLGLVVRFPQLYGLGGTFFQTIFENLSKPNARITLFNDEYRTVALGSDVARMCIDFLEHATPEDYKQVFLGYFTIFTE